MNKVLKNLLFTHAETFAIEIGFSIASMTIFIDSQSAVNALNNTVILEKNSLRVSLALKSKAT